MYVEKQDFLPGIHVLRGLAAVATIFFHLRFMGEGRKVDYLSFVEHFGAGVTLFFILSCFSLFHSTVRKLEFPNWIAGYALRRIYRIYPLFLCMLVFYLFALNILFDKTFSISEIILNATVLYQYYPGHHASIVWAGWTIGVEVTFYCIFPILFSLSRKLIFWMSALLIAMAVSMQVPTVVANLGLEKSFSYMSFPRQMFVFILGGVIYLLANRQKDNKRYFSLYLSLSLFGLWAVTSKMVIDIKLMPDLLMLKTLALGCFVYFFYDKSFLYNRFTKFLGETSYSIYLLHPAAILITKPIVRLIYHTSLPVDISFAISFSLVFAVVLTTSFFINKYFEMPVYYFGVSRAKLAEGKAYSPST